MCCLKIDTETLLANCLNTCKTYSFSPDDLQQILTPPTIEIVGFLGGAARFIAKPCLKQRVMRFPIIHYGCSA